MKSTLLIVFLLMSLNASNYVVIANKKLHMKEQNTIEIKNIFLRKHKIERGIQLIPVNIKRPKEIRLHFNRTILGMSGERLQRYWMNRHYLGERAPKEIFLKDAINFVKKNRGAIAYSKLELLHPEVDIVYIIEARKKIVVVANKKLGLKHLSQKELKMIFLKREKLHHNIALVPVNLEALNNIRKVFEKNILKLSREEIQEFWTKEHYLGERPPVTLKSSQSVLSFVRKIDGAIGYVPIEDLYDKVDIIYEF